MTASSGEAVIAGGAHGAAHIVAVRALLEEIKVREPSRTDVAQAVAAASGGALTPAVCGRVADAVLALWNP